MAGREVNESISLRVCAERTTLPSLTPVNRLGRISVGRHSRCQNYEKKSSFLWGGGGMGTPKIVLSLKK